MADLAQQLAAPQPVVTGAGRPVDASARSWLRQQQRADAWGHLVLDRLYAAAGQSEASHSVVRRMARQLAQGDSVLALDSSRLESQLASLNLSPGLAAQLRQSLGANASTRRHGLLARGNDAAPHALYVEEEGSAAADFRLFDNSGDGADSSNAQLGTPGGMLWLQGSPQQSRGMAQGIVTRLQSVTDSLQGWLEQSGQAVAGEASANAGADRGALRWSSFAGRQEMAGGLFLGQLNQAMGSLPASNDSCDTLLPLLAANLGVATGGGLDSRSISLPEINSQPVTAGQEGEPYQYLLQARDPQGLPLQYSVLQGPGNLQIAANGQVSWSQPVRGIHAVTLRVDNGRGYAEQRYLLEIGAQAALLQVSVNITPQVANAGEALTLQALASGGNAPLALSVTLDGQPVSLDAQGQARFAAAASGVHWLEAQVRDSHGQVNLARTLYTVRNTADKDAPQVQLSSPQQDAEISAPLSINGTVQDANLAYYRVLYRMAGSSDDSWQELGRGTQNVAGGRLAGFDPSQLENGFYGLLLVAYDVNGASSSDSVTVEVRGNLKVGQFAITFEDLSVQTSGIPIQVTRTYDTRKKKEALDFGYGWTVDYQGSAVRKNVVTGFGWQVYHPPGSVLNCLRVAGKRRINITLPNGQMQRFEVQNKAPCAIGSPPLDIQITALDGSTGVLAFERTPNLILTDQGLYDTEDNQLWDPKDFRLTTEDKYVYHLRQGVGILKIEDPYGATLTYGQNGILHSALSFVTPEQRHTGRAAEILEQRRKIYAQARERHPLRWKRTMRAWSIPDAVWLNPQNKQEQRHAA